MPLSAEDEDRYVTRREMKQRLAALRDLFDEKDRAHQRALELQAAEYARRMNELNHAHQLAQENWARSLPRETFAGFQSDWDKWRADVNANVSAFTGGLALLRFVGAAGLLAFFMELLRLAGVTK